MALFESANPDTPSSFSALLGQVLGQNPSIPRGPSYDHIAGIHPTAGLPGGILNTGHDRPYRFSFYSNALSATIHARSLSELPAEGQTFEELFQGVNGTEERPDGVNVSRPTTSMGFNGPFNGPGPRIVPPIPMAERSGISKMSMNGKDPNGVFGNNGKTTEVNTW